MQETFKWEGRFLILPSGKFELAEGVKPDEIRDVAARLELQSEVWGTLKVAKESFGTGQAEYQDCYQKLLDLEAGYAQSNLELMNVMQDVGTFFSPPLDFRRSVPRTIRVQVAVATVKLLIAEDQERARKAAEQPEPPAQSEEPKKS